MKLLLAEIGFHNRQITKLRKEIASLENNLFSVVTYFMKIKIVAFIKHMCVVHHETVLSTHYDFCSIYRALLRALRW